jgi:hypothetical protein
MRTHADRVGSLVVGIGLLVSLDAHALDATGTWEGKWRCRYFNSSTGSFVTQSNPTSTMKISQVGNDLNVEIDSQFFRYNGLIDASAADPDRGAATLISCNTDLTLSQPGSYNELLSARFVTDPTTGSGTFRATSTAQQMNALAAVCHYVLERVSTVDPGVPDPLQPGNCVPLS